MGDRAGQRLDNYQLVRLLGAGSFGEVYLAEHIHRKTQVAMKVLPQLSNNTPVVPLPLPQQIWQPAPNIAMQSSVKQPSSPTSEIATSLKSPILPQPIPTINKGTSSKQVSEK